MSERFVPNGSDAFGDRHAGQATAIHERPISDGGDALRDRQAGQGTARIER